MTHDERLELVGQPIQVQCGDTLLTGYVFGAGMEHPSLDLDIGGVSICTSIGCTWEQAAQAIERGARIPASGDRLIPA